MIKFILTHFFLCCLLLIGGVFYYLTMTVPGLQTDIQIATKMLAGKLRVESAQGKLFSDFELKNIVYEDATQSIHVKSFAFSWNPAGLLLHKWMINSIKLDQATIVISKLSGFSNNKTGNANYIHFVKNITLKQATFHNVFIKLADSDIAINGNLEKNWNIQWKVHISDLSTFLPGYHDSLSLTGDMTGPLLSPKIFTSYNNLRLLTYYFKELKQPSGTFQTTLWINGIFTKPEIIAQFKLLNGKVHIPSLGITPHDIYLEGTTTSSRQLHFTGHFISGEGQANLQGSIDLNNPDYPLTLQAKGSQLQAIHLKEYNIIISPDITLEFAKQTLKLNGNILIPYANIAPDNFGSSVELPNDVVFVDSKKSIELPFTTTLQLTLKLGDKIHLAYHDIEAQLGGQIQLSQLPGTLVNAVGELYTKNGVYTAYGQTLKIRTGRLIYTGGSLMNPGLNISAVKKLKTVNTGGNVSSFSGPTQLKTVYAGTESITVGVEVTGTLDNPVFSLYSSPILSQADILSYLIFGFPQSQANGNQYGAILSALSSLNPNTPSVGNLTKNLEQKLGLTEMGMQSVQVFNPNATTSSNAVVSTTSFVIGKKLSDKLSIHYSVGLFYPVSILNLRYELTKHWAIQSETSTLDNGADMLYTIEWD